MKVIEKICFFGPDYSESDGLPHISTRGTTFKQHFSKAANWASLNLADVYDSTLPSSNSGSQFRCKQVIEDSSVTRFLTSGKQLANNDILRFNQNLIEKYPGRSSSIRFLDDSLKSSFYTIQGLDPHFVVTGEEAPCDIAQDWYFINDQLRNVQPLPSEEQSVEEFFFDVGNYLNLKPETVSGYYEQCVAKYKERYILYPFVFPPNNKIGFCHIVLIVIDQQEEKIYYYDSKGQTSDDPDRKGIFRDDPYFNMHKNLVALARSLFNKSVSEVIENVAIHQMDPINCGVFVCRAIERLYQGMSVSEALNYNPKEELIRDARKRMGIAFMQAIQELNDLYISQQPEVSNATVLSDYLSGLDDVADEFNNGMPDTL